MLTKLSMCLRLKVLSIWGVSGLQVYGVYVADWCTVKQLRLDQSMTNLICRDLEIPLVVIPMGVTGLKKTGLVCLLNFFGERGEDIGWCDFTCVNLLDPIQMGGEGQKSPPILVFPV